MLRRPPPPPARPNRYQTLLIDGKRFFEAGDYATALQIYQSACQMAPPGDNQPFAQACKCIRRVARTFLKQEDYATVARMIALVTEAQAMKAPSERFSDWFGQRYTIAVLAGSILAYLGFWLFGRPPAEALYRAASLVNQSTGGLPWEGVGR